MSNKFHLTSLTSTEEIIDEAFKPSEKWRIWRNVIVTAFAFMIHFTAFSGASNLQSSININEALGTFTLATVYGSLVILNMFLPAIILKWLDCKWTMVFSLLLYVPFIASLLYPRFFTMIPAGFLVGLGAAPLWCAKGTFLSVISKAYSQITGITPSVVLPRFIGVFLMFLELSQIWGNLISSAVLSSDFNVEFPTHIYINNSNKSIANQSFLDNICGASFCTKITSQINSNFKPPPAERMHLLIGVYLACMIVASVTVAIGVDTLRRYDQNRKSSAAGLSGLKLLAVTLRNAMTPYQILTMPISMFIGAQQAFITADYTASFVTCGLGITKIGYTMMFLGAAEAIGAIGVVAIAKKVTRVHLIGFVFLLHQTLLITLLIWKPHPERRAMFFVIPALWGVSDAVWVILLNTINGLLFPGKEEAAFSNFRVWESIGAVITFAYNPYLCTNVKIYILMGLMALGVLGCIAVEIMENTSKVNCAVNQSGNFRLISNSNRKIETD